MPSRLGAWARSWRDTVEQRPVTRSGLASKRSKRADSGIRRLQKRCCNRRQNTLKSKSDYYEPSAMQRSVPSATACSRSRTGYFLGKKSRIRKPAAAAARKDELPELGTDSTPRDPEQSGDR